MPPDYRKTDIDQLPSDPASKDTNGISFGIPVLLFVVVIVLWLATYFWLHDDPERGSFGDMFGSINALFSGLAFLGVVYAILLQRKELSLQRGELELTRMELRGQKEQLAAQNETLLQQSAENTFFQLMRLQQDIVSSIDLVDPNDARKITRGRDCIKVFYARFTKLWGTRLNDVQGMEERDKINKIYLGFYSQYQGEVGHYFRSLYNIVKFVDSSNLTDKRLYTNLVRAQMSNYELALMFYNCLSDLGMEKFRPLIDKYALLKNLPLELLTNPPDHKILYLDTAYE